MLGLDLGGEVLRVLVAANHDLAGRLEIILQSAGAETELVTDPAAAISRLQATDGITLLDYDMPGLAGTRAVQLARSLLGERPLGVVYGLASPGMAHRTLSAGATGVLPDNLDSETMKAALRLLEQAKRFCIFSGAIQLVPFDAATALTDRELQVLHGVCDGLQNKEIAHRFSISEVTVKMHVRAVIRKLGARNRTQAAMIARDMKIV
ncbi:MAG TPA: hypothetical protein DIU07_13525 [Rhodobacteraceae bacterium]|mgnify:CR=1 FL=1|nr:hypothetical protein [Paracoccaceae bacterium]